MSQPINMTPPTVGRIVHVAWPPLADVAAIVTAVTGSDGTIMATVFPPGGSPRQFDEIEHVEPTPDAPNPPAGTWHWPGDPMKRAHPWPRQSDIGGGVAMTPFPFIGQPCGGMECDGEKHLCEACEHSYKDHFDSLRPY